MNRLLKKTTIIMLIFILGATFVSCEKDEKESRVRESYTIDDIDTSKMTPEEKERFELDVKVNSKRHKNRLDGIEKQKENKNNN